jgi:hypothetical protein
MRILPKLGLSVMGVTGSLPIYMEDTPTPPLANLTGWWKGYSLLYSDAGITPATAEDTPIYRIGDNQGSANEDQTTLGLRPLLKLAQTPSGKSVARYDGSDDYSVATLNGTAYTALTWGFVLRPLDTSVTKGMLSWGNALSSGTPFVLVQRDGTDTRIYVNSGYRWAIAHATTDFEAYVLSWNGTDWNLSVNGVAQSPYTGGGASQANASSIYIGNGFNGYCNMDFAELVVYNAVVDQAALSSYLMTQHGIT